MSSFLKNKKIIFAVALALSLLGAMIGWIAWIYVIKMVLEYAKVKKPNLFTKWYAPASLGIIVLMVILYGAYNYFIVTPNLPQ